MNKQEEKIVNRNRFQRTEIAELSNKHIQTAIIYTRCFQSKRNSEHNEKNGRFFKKNLLEVLEMKN